MQKFKFSLLVLCFLFTFSGCNNESTDGTYKIVRNPEPTKQLEVVEFFAYFCPHCFRLDPRVRAWEKTLPKNVHFIRIPLTLGHNSARVYSRAYYLSQKLGIFERSHLRIFDDFHNKKIQITSDQQLKRLFMKLGASEADIDKALADPELNQLVDKAEQTAKYFGIVSVPSFVVNGKYLTDAGMTSGVAGLFKKINFLLRKDLNKKK